MASSVVGTCTTSTPRWYTAAAKPAVSPTTPPPSATTASSRSSPHCANCRHRSSTVARVLWSSPSPMKNVSCATPRRARARPRVVSTHPFGISACVTTATRRRPASTVARSPIAAPPDHDVVAARAEIDADANGHAAASLEDRQHRVGGLPRYRGPRCRPGRARPLRRPVPAAARAGPARLRDRRAATVGSSRRRRESAASRPGPATTRPRPRRAQGAAILGIENRAAAARDRRAAPATHTRRPRPRARYAGTRGSPAVAKIPSTLICAVWQTRSSVSTNARPSRRAHSVPTLVFPAPMSPISTRCFAVISAWRGTRRGCGRTRRASRRRTCATPPTRARARPSSPRRHPRPGPRSRRSAP